MKTVNKIVLALIATAVLSFGHGNVTPQPMDTKSLKKVSSDVVVNPYRGNKTAIEIGKSGYNSNCARCHGLGAISGGIAPDLRNLPAGDDESDEYFIDTVKEGIVRNGNVYMPPFKEVLSAEAIWTIRSWVETVPAN